MVEEPDARRLAEGALAAMDPLAYVIVEVEEYEVGWVYVWNSRRYHETGAVQDALVGNAPILVDRVTGSVHFTGTARPVAEYVARYVSRDPNDERSWHP